MEYVNWMKKVLEGDVKPLVSQGIQNRTKALLVGHAIRCTDPQCGVKHCILMKRIFLHAKKCQQKSSCMTCKSITSFVMRYHAKQCTAFGCLVPLCSDIKRKLVQQSFLQQAERLQLLSNRYRTQAEILRSRAAAIGSEVAGSVNGATATATAAAVGLIPSPPHQKARL